MFYPRGNKKKQVHIIDLRVRTHTSDGVVTIDFPLKKSRFLIIVNRSKSSWNHYPRNRPIRNPRQQLRSTSLSFCIPKRLTGRTLNGTCVGAHKQGRSVPVKPLHVTQANALKFVRASSTSFAGRFRCCDASSCREGVENGFSPAHGGNTKRVLYVRVIALSPTVQFSPGDFYLLINVQGCPSGYYTRRTHGAHVGQTTTTTKRWTVQAVQ